MAAKPKRKIPKLKVPETWTVGIHPENNADQVHVSIANGPRTIYRGQPIQLPREEAERLCELEHQGRPLFCRLVGGN